MIVDDEFVRCPLASFLLLVLVLQLSERQLFFSPLSTFASYFQLFTTDFSL